MFDDIQPGELLLLLKNFKIAIDGTRTTTAYGQINYRSTMLRGKTLREFNELQSKYGGSTNNHIKLIQEGLLEYFFPIDSLSKKKRAMRRAMSKPWSIIFKHFAARLMEMNNFLPIFPGFYNSKKM